MARQRRFTVSVRVRILASILVVTAAGMAIAGGTAYLVQRERTLAHVDQRLSDTAERLRSIGSNATFTGVRPLLEAGIQQITPDTNEGILGIVDGTAAVVPGGGVGLSLAKQTGLVARVVSETSGDQVVIGTADTSLGALRYVAIPVTVTSDSAAGIYVAAFSLDAELAAIADAFTTYALVALAALVVIGLVGWFVAGRLLRPIRRLRDTAARISATDLSERIPVVGNDDVSELTATVNDMLDRLDESLTAQRTLLDDVGHELKTPITIVRGHLEVMDVNDAADVAATRDLAVDELDRMSGLVTDISLLASVQRTASITLEPTDVRELTETVFRKISAIAGRRWVLADVADGVAPLDADRVTQAWMQLASNAARYATEGTPIAIGSEIDEAAQQLHLWVRDEGPGIPLEAQSRIFERFRREDEGRGSSGSGLGLAIVAGIAAAHGGAVTLDSAAGSGSTFTLVLPLAEVNDSGSAIVPPIEEVKA